jgi:lipopolysaccharide transport system ATP-binding protein
MAVRIMSSEHAILVENLSKRYLINHTRHANDGLRHRVEATFRNSFRWLWKRADGACGGADYSLPRSRQTREEFWALRDVSFEVKQGDVVGIIGRNGAGKSTLLKILSRITEPTTGRISLYGRVASLLEVGTGFHQELTGRENIFLNGAILGMTKAEIKRKLDEIVAFSEIEKFLDTPVKRYSSGMYVRLAFAVAAHLEPEILIVDEVLAVGDAAFQKKCLGKMGEVAKGGRTVLFVSHNMPAVQALCSKAIYLHQGTVRAAGPVDSLLQQYLSETGSAQGQSFKGPLSLGTSLKLLAIELNPNPVESGESLCVILRFRAERPVTFTDLSLLVNAAQGARIALIDLRSLGLPFTIPAGATWNIKAVCAALPFVEGDYSVGLAVNIGELHENIFDLVGFSVRARISHNDYVPYPVVYRGVVELKFSAHSTLDRMARLAAAPLAEKTVEQ